MDLGRILDGTPEPPAIVPSLDFFSGGKRAPADKNSALDYVLPVPMTPFQKQLTDDVVSLHYSDILRFFECGSLDNQVLHDSLASLYANTQLVATHPYLLVQHYLPPNLLLKDVPNRLTNSSGKFAVLVKLIDMLRDKKVDVALVSRAGKSFDLIEALLLGRAVNYRRYSGSYLRQSTKSFKKASTIHLFPSSHLSSTYIGSERFHLVIAFDLTFNPEDAHITAIRTQGRGANDTPAPIIRLIPYYSAEHIVYKFQNIKSDDETLYMKRVVAAIVVLRGRAGSVPVDLRPHYASGLKFLAPWLEDPVTHPWTLPKTPDIEIYSAQDVEKSLLTEVNVDAKHPIDPESSTNFYSTSISSNQHDNSSNNQANGHSHNNHSSNSSSSSTSQPYSYSLANGVPKQFTKSGRDLSHPNIHRYYPEDENENDEYYNAKRLKRERYSPGDPETATSFLAPPGGGLYQQQSDRQILTHKILRRLDNATRDLALRQAEVTSLRSQASVRQSMYEDLSTEAGKLVTQISTLKEQLQVQERKSERSDAEVEKLTTKIEQQTKDLEEAREMLANGPPELATLEKQLVRIAELEDLVKKANERADLRTTENEYMRSEYQKASTAATDALEEVKTLTTAKKALEVRLESRAIELNRLTFDEERKIKDLRIAELETRAGNIEEHLKRLQKAERHQPTRSRYGMRNSSSNSRRNNSPSVSGGSGSNNGNGRRGSPAIS
ncbi:uncharacterized protein SAPINGB_P003134 [Magnusiomyces paraingens]|uniref:Uncharacterized protein n=1 Tax=Magnusiomyces paraingens TaxID=2606893 RepID=A0A5E8BKW0_9ASCO|nr:uncharacterized protein SAPINGB_P003134 [Saprochaete ingens]VVT51552.1 unnamed protein product [Saprochaete ingens]